VSARSCDGLCNSNCEMQDNNAVYGRTLRLRYILVSQLYSFLSRSTSSVHLGDAKVGGWDYWLSSPISFFAPEASLFVSSGGHYPSTPFYSYRPDRITATSTDCRHRVLQMIETEHDHCCSATCIGRSLLAGSPYVRT